MFLKMLKGDLKQKKGLSVVLFLFITAASVLIFVGGVQIYEYLTGSERNQAACRSSSLLVYQDTIFLDQQPLQQALETALDKETSVTSRYHRELLRVPVACVDFAYINETTVDEMRYAGHYLTTLPQGSDLLYTLDDRPFAVENGTVWLSTKMQTIVGAQEGDTLRITDDLGYVYTLTVAGFYKRPYEGYDRWYVISDGDYAYLSATLHNKTNLYGLQWDGDMDVADYVGFVDRMRSVPYSDIVWHDAESSNDYILSYILSIFLALVGLFLILIVMMTIRFTMVAALKEEEKEIGTLRAIGVDSLRFRWLFAAKYIFFAIIGGVIGMAVGLPLAKLVIRMFEPGNILPSDGEMLLIGIGSVLLMIGMIVGFSLLVMRRMNRLSVVGALRGESRTERFGASRGLLLHRRKKMAPAFYLAVSDLLKRFKRYVFLLLAYTLGVLIILLTVNLRHSVITPDYLKYSMMYQMDFSLEFTNQQIEAYVKRMVNNGEELWDMVNEEIKAAGIPAHIDAEHYQTSGSLLLNGTEATATIWWGKGDISRLSYHEGTVPVHKDEAAISWSAAHGLGIQLGDKITLKIPSNSADSKEAAFREESFRVTAFINAMDGGMPITVLGSEYEGTGASKSYMAMIIDTDEAQKDSVLQQLRAHFGDEVVLSGMEYTRKMLAEYVVLFDLLVYAVGGAVLFILMLMTYLYTRVFIAEESAEIALLKSIGFSERSIKLSHLLRILLLSVMAVVLGELLLRTLGQWLVGVLMEILGITGFSFLPEYLLSLVVVPVLTLVSVLLVQWLNLRTVRHIDIRHIKDE